MRGRETGARRNLIPLPPAPQPRSKEKDCLRTAARGLAVLNTPLLNKGTAFTAVERKALGLTGLIPPAISTLDAQVKRAYAHYERLPDVCSRNMYLTILQDRNEVLFCRLFSGHLREMIPIVNGVAAGIIMKQHDHQECRRPRGLYLSIDHPEWIDEAFANLDAAADDVDLLVATDGDRVLGIGDWGVRGMQALIGRLAVYAAGGIDPGRMIPVMLDAGTNRNSLLNDPAYTGNRHGRIRGERYDAFIDAFVHAAVRRFPRALLEWEGLAPGNGQRILQKYGGTAPTFNGDIEGAGAITLAAAISAGRVCGTPLRSHRVVIFGAGMAGMGAAGQLRAAMVQEGLSSQEAARRFWCVDRRGLLTTGRADPLPGYQADYARPQAEVKGWQLGGNGLGPNLAEVVRRVKPTMLIGASAAAGSFTEPVVRQMAANTERPVIIVLSKLLSRAEANPADLIAWTDGRALIAAGSPFAPVTYKGVTYVVAETNDAMLCPGLVLGVTVSRAARVTAAMLTAAASALSSLVTVRQPGAPLLPHIDDLRSVSATVAAAVVETAQVEGVSRVRCGDIVAQVLDGIWQPEYRPVLAR
jgi:malate dehydrogenase (oxaloacetate-decarboxylating)